MKKFLALLLALTCMVSITACKNNEADKKEEKKEDKYEVAVWEDYEDMPFMEFLEKGTASYYRQLYPEVEITGVSYEKGWENATSLTEDDVTKRHTPVTYIVELKTDDKTSGTLFFFMERKSKKLKAVSSYSCLGEEASDIADKTATEDFLDDFATALKYEERKGNISSDADEAQLIGEYFLDAYCDYDYETAESYMSGELPENVTVIYDTVEANKASNMNEATSLLGSIGLEFDTFKPQCDNVYNNIIDKLRDKTSYKDLKISGINGTYAITGKLTLPSKKSIPDPLANFDIKSFSASMMVKAIKNGYIDYSGNYEDGVTEQDLIDFVAKELVNSLNEDVDKTKITTEDIDITLTLSWIDGEWLITSFETNENN